MNCSKTMLIFLLLMASGCTGMQKLDFTEFEKDLGKQKGEREARILLSPHQESNDLLNPLMCQLETSLRLLKDFPGAKNEFERFVFGYARVLVKHNLQNTSSPYIINGQALQEKLDAQQLDELDDRQKESRKELITLLTATLSKAQLLTLN